MERENKFGTSQHMEILQILIVSIVYLYTKSSIVRNLFLISIKWV